MTGLEKMVSQILEEADASAAVMISDAEKKAAEILGEAGEKADKIRQQREEQSRAKVKSFCRRYEETYRSSCSQAGADREGDCGCL